VVTLEGEAVDELGLVAGEVTHQRRV
jgi:hypothetical protein